MHIGIAGPIATADIAAMLDAPAASLPRGYSGAPFLTTLIEEFVARGHRVSAFTLSSDMPLDGGKRVARGPSGLSLYYVPMRPRAWPFNGRRVGRIVDLYAFERRAMEQAMLEAAPDVVHAHWAYEFAWAAIDSGLPHVVTCHDSPLVIARMSSGFRRGGYRWLRAAMAWYVLRRAKCVTTVSPYMQRQLARWCATTIALVPNPVDRRAFTLSRSGRTARARIGMICNGWSTFKNPQAALIAFDLLSRQHDGAELVVCGEDFGPGGDAAAWWRDKALAGRIEFRGPLPHSAVLELMSDCDVLLHPSLEESFGMVVAEAMAIGLPVVAGASSGAVPWVVGDAGGLVDVGNPASIAAALADALGAGRDGCAAAAVRARADALSRFHVGVIAGQYEASYRAATAATMRSPVRAFQ